MQNESTKSVRSIEIVVRQFAEICLAETVKYKRVVTSLPITEGFPIDQGEQLEKSFEVKATVVEMQGMTVQEVVVVVVVVVVVADYPV